MTKQTKQKICAYGSIALALALSVGLVFSALEWWTDKGPSTWGKKNEDVQASAGGMIIEDGETSEGDGKISLVTKQIAREDFDEYGIMPIAESAYKVTASVKDEADATPDYLQKVKWAMAWKSTNSATVTTYVTMTEDGASATFTCLKAFSTQIVVTCTSTIDTSKSATVTLDYAKRLTGVKVQFNTGAETAIQKTATTITATLPADYDGSSVHRSDAPWIAGTYQLYWYKTLEFGTEGTVNNTASVDVTITPSSALKTAYNSRKSSSAKSLMEALSVPSGAGTPVNGMNKFYLNLAQGGSDDQALVDSGIYRAMSLALYDTKSAAQFTVKLDVKLKYGGTETYTYSLKVLMDKAPVKSLTVDHSSFVF